MFKVALCQLIGNTIEDVKESKIDRINEAKEAIEEAVKNGAKIVCLPEMWLCPYVGHKFREYSETEEGETVKWMSEMAKKNNIVLIGGSIPEYDPSTDKVYNTSFSFDQNGQILGKHRKVHLFDIDVKEGVNADGTIRPAMKYLESRNLGAGEKTTVFDIDIDGEKFTVGVAICFDIRFPQLFLEMAKKGAKLIFLPASFNWTTGPAHWDLAIRSRAVDNQAFFCACAPAMNEESAYHSYGHSRIASPWGEMLAMTDEKKDIVYYDMDMNYVDQIRDQLPLISTWGRGGLDI